VSRGDLVKIAVSGEYGKPRPALVIQSDALDAHPSVVVLPLTSELHKAPLFRINVGPGMGTGLREQCQVMVDKVTTVPRTKIGSRMGQLDAETMDAVGLSLRRFLGV